MTKPEFTSSKEERLEHYRQRAARVKPESFGDPDEARREDLEVFEMFRRTRERANALAEYEPNEDK